MSQSNIKDFKSRHKNLSKDSIIKQIPIKAFSWHGSQAPEFDSLSIDDRKILVASQGMVWINFSEKSQSSIDGVTVFLSHLSQEIILEKYISIFQIDANNGFLISIQLNQSSQKNASQFFDKIASVTNLGGHQLYIGQNTVFVRYRDSFAPQGYDVSIDSMNNKEIHLVDRDTTYCLPEKYLSQKSLSEILINLPLYPDYSSSLPKMAYALVAFPLYRVLSQYFHNHQLDCHMAHIQCKNDGIHDYVLFELVPKNKQVIPSYILSYIDSLPECVVLIKPDHGKAQGFLIEWKTKHPCKILNIESAFPQNSLIIMSLDNAIQNMCIHPYPSFFPSNDILKGTSKERTKAKLAVSSDPNKLSLSIPVKLVYDHSHVWKNSAVIFQGLDRKWLKSMFYWLPTSIFKKYKIFTGEKHIVLMAETSDIEHIPFGIQFRRIQDSSLFIPLKTRFSPDLPWSMLSKALKLKKENYTFLTAKYRIELPFNHFVPLSRSLHSGSKRPGTQMKLIQPSKLPKLDWPYANDLKKLSDMQMKDDAEISQKETIRSQTSSQTNRTFNSNRYEPSSSIHSIELFRQQANKFHEQGDDISAAVCLSIAGDEFNAAMRLKNAALKLTKEKIPA